MSDLDWPELGGLVAVLLCLSLALNFIWRIWPAPEGEVRLSRLSFGGALFALTFGLWHVGYGIYLQVARHDETGSVPIFFALFFIAPAIWTLWRWLTWRLWIRADGLLHRGRFGQRRIFGWSEIVCIRGRYFSRTFVVETKGRDKIVVPLASEGVVLLLDAAIRQSILFVDFERFEREGLIRLSTRKLAVL